MKTMMTLVTFLIMSTAMAKTTSECEKWVEQNLETFAICSSHDEHLKDSFYYYRVEQCKKTSHGFTCEVTQDWPSSECSQEIYLDHRCYFNTGAKIINDTREDL